MSTQERAGAMGPSRDLIASTAKAACRIASGRLAAAAASSTSAALTRRIVAGMALKNAVAGMTLILLGFAGAGLAYSAIASKAPGVGSEPRATARYEAAREPDPAAERVRSETRSTTEKALAVVDSIDDLEKRVWLLSGIADVQARAGLFDAYAGTMKRLLKAAQETESEHRLIEAAEAIAQAGDAETAVRLVEPLDLNRDYGLDHVASALARAGDVAGALRVAETIRKEPYRSETFRVIAVAQAEGGDERGAFETAARASDGEARAFVQAAVAARQSRARVPAAAQSLKRLRQTADEIAQASRAKGKPGAAAVVLARIVEVLADAGLDDDARKVADEITYEPWHDIAWKSIAAAQAGRGEIAEALRTTDRMCNVHAVYKKGEALAAVVAAQAAANDFNAARALAGKIEPGLSRIDALLAIARGRHRSGRLKEAAETFEDARREADSLRDEPGAGNARSAVLYRLARAQAEVGEERAALAWIDATTEPSVKAWALWGLAKGLAQRLPASPPPKIRIALPADVDQAAASRTAEPASNPIASFRGKIVLFGVRRPGDREGRRIEMMNPDGTGSETVVVLEKGEGIYAGRIAPDGERLAFSFTQVGRTSPDLWTLTTDRTRRKVADDLHVVAWSPDGRRLAAIRADAKTRRRENLILDVENGHEDRLAIPEDDEVDDWSPDGETLTVMAGNKGQVFEHPTKGTYPLRQIYFLRPDGTQRTPLTTRPMADSLNARFSPDGGRILYFQRRHPEGLVLHFAVVQGRDGAAPRDIAQFDEIYKGNDEKRPNGAPCWSPDGESVVWMVPRRKVQSAPIRFELLILSVETGQAHRLDLHPLGIEWVQAVDWR
jgi:hypothetical protein